MIEFPSKREMAVRAMLGWTPPKGFENRLEHSHTAVMALILADALIPEVVNEVTQFVVNCIQPDHGLNDGAWPESEMECAYSAVRAMRLCGTLDRYPEREELIEWICSKQNEDGGFGALCDWGQAFEHEKEVVAKDMSVLGFHQESSSHACFFAYGALEALGATEKANLSDLVEFLVNDQKEEGGWPFYPTNPRPNTITTAMALHVLRKLDTTDKIDKKKTIDWLVACQAKDGSFDGYPGLGESFLQELYTGRASKALRILNALNCIDYWKFEEYWNKRSIVAGGWNVVCRGMAMGVPLILQER